MKKANHNNQDMLKNILPRLNADMAKTLEARKRIVDLRAKKIDQDLGQVNVYLNILENQKDIKLNPRAIKKLDKLLSWKPKGKAKTYADKQKELEKHFLDLQKFLIGLISKKFKY
jgi:hypothetical protein